MFDLDTEQVRGLVAIARKNNWFSRAREFDQFRQVVVFQNISRMQTQAPVAAWELLYNTVLDPRARGETRVRAAEAILDRSGFPAQKDIRYQDLNRETLIPLGDRDTNDIIVEIEHIAQEQRNSSKIFSRVPPALVLETRVKKRESLNSDDDEESFSIP